MEELLAVDDVRCRGVEDLGGLGAEVALEVRDVDDGVAAGGGGQGEFVGDVGAGFEYGVRSVEFWPQFPTSADGSGGVEEGGFDPDEVPGGEGDVVAVAVGGEGLCGLSFFELLADTAVDGGHVLDEGVGVNGAEVGGVGGEGGRGAGVVAIADEEGGLAGGGMDGVVVGEGDGGELEVPVVLEEVDVGSEGSNDGFVGVLSLSVGLRVVGGGHVELGAGEIVEGLPHLGSEPRVAV